MKIIDSPQPKPVTFGDLKPGDVFSAGGFVYQKLSKDHNEAVVLGNGVSVAYDRQYHVTPHPQATLYLDGPPAPAINAKAQELLDALAAYKLKNPGRFDTAYSTYDARWTRIIKAYESTLTPEPK